MRLITSSLVFCFWALEASVVLLSAPPEVLKLLVCDFWNSSAACVTAFEILYELCGRF